MKQSNSAINFPNIISIIRILITPLLVIFLIKKMFFSALIVFTIAGISDGLDGFLARCFNQHTELGAYLDPLADKLLLTTAFVSLAILKIVPDWLTVIVISRDVLILLGIAILTIIEIDITIKPTLVSKCTTVAQLATIFIILTDHSISSINTIRWLIYWPTAGLTIISGIYYIVIGLKMLQNGSKNNLRTNSE